MDFSEVRRLPLQKPSIVLVEIFWQYSSVRLFNDKFQAPMGDNESKED